MNINDWRMPFQPWLQPTTLPGLATVTRNQIDGWEALVLRTVNAQATWAEGISRQVRGNSLVPGAAQNMLEQVQSSTEQMVQMQGMMWRKWFQWLRTSTGEAATAGEVLNPESAALAVAPERLPEVQRSPANSRPPSVAEAMPVADDLTTLHGVGPAIAKKLNAVGIVSFKQIAAWTDADVEQVEETVLAGRFAGRIHKDEWIDQARSIITATG